MAIPSRDRDGNTFSPKLRADQKELDELYAQAPAYAAEGEAELERLFAAGAERRAAGQTHEARECHIACYLLARELNWRSREAEALALAALGYLELGELQQGVELLEGSRKLHEALGDADGQAEALCNLGLAHAAQGELEEARGAHERALLLAQDRALRLTTLNHLGSLHLRRGCAADAQLVLAQGLALAIALGDVEAEARVLQRLAVTHTMPRQRQRSPAEEVAATAATAAVDAKAASAPADAVGEEEVVAAPAEAEADEPRIVEVVEEAAAQEAASPAAGEAAAEEAAAQEEAVEATAEEAEVEEEAAAEPDGEAAAAALRCLLRAEELASRAVSEGSADTGAGGGGGAGAAVLLQVLRQLRAQYLAMGDGDGARRCELRIDGLLRREEEEAAAAAAAEEEVEVVEEGGGGEESREDAALPAAEGAGADKREDGAPGTLV